MTIVSKFGGSVLKDAESYRKAASYVISRNAVPLVSAMQGVTDRYTDIYQKGVPEGQFDIHNIYQRVAEPLPQKLYDEAMNRIKERNRRREIYLDARNMDAFVGSGEGDSAILLNCHIMAQGGDSAFLTGSMAGFLINDYGLVEVEASRLLLKDRVGEKLSAGQIPVVGGYLGRHHKTGGYKIGARNINDEFAAVLADALDATAIEIIKDVPGVYRVPPGFGNYGLLDNLSYDEAGKMSWRGSPVVYPGAIRIAHDKNMSIIVKTMESKGTVISDKSETTTERPVAALVPEITCMVTVRDDRMATPEGRGYLALVAQFERDQGDVGHIAADLNELSYTITLGDRKSNKNAEMLANHNKELIEHMNSHGYRPTVDGQEVGIITMVGDKMQKRPGTLSYLSGILGERKLSVRSATQSDEKYSPPGVTFVVDSDKLETSVKALAEELFV